MTLHSTVSGQPVERAGDDIAAAMGQEKPAISVIGLGYVGAVSMACLSHLGFRMVGVDISREKVHAINEGVSPIVEERLGELLKEGVESNRISATQNLVAAVFETDVTFLSVGTPTSKDGGCDFTFVRQASRAIGQAIGMKSGYHVVVLRCSVPPGTTLDVVVPEIETASGKKLGPDFGVCFNPEFLREGVAVADFFAPPKTVVGASDTRAERTVTAIYEAVDKKVIFTSIESAEMVKYVDNVWHATKVAFGNEVGRLCKKLNIDSHDVMNIFVKDLKLNLSPYYLKPGFAFGGSCLPKEVRAVSHIAHAMGVEVPLIDSLTVSNQRHIAQAITLLQGFKGKRIGFLGVTFKPDTDDMRESPTLDVMATLHNTGEQIRAYDPNLNFGPLLQHQIDYVRHAVPAQAKLMDELQALTVASADELVAHSDVVVVSHATDEFRNAIKARNPDIHVLDLARLFKEIPAEATYQGIAW
jgi:GDP-mannose 6-dehydrogenase